MSKHNPPLWQVGSVQFLYTFYTVAMTQQNTYLGFNEYKCTLLIIPERLKVDGMLCMFHFNFRQANPSGPLICMLQRFEHGL